MHQLYEIKSREDGSLEAVRISTEEYANCDSPVIDLGKIMQPSFTAVQASRVMEMLIARTSKKYSPCKDCTQPAKGGWCFKCQKKSQSSSSKTTDHSATSP